MAGGFGLDNFFIPTDGTLRIYNKPGTNYNQLGVSPDAIGQISVDGVTLTTNSEGAIEINLANANTWTATQTFQNNEGTLIILNSTVKGTADVLEVQSAGKTYLSIDNLGDLTTVGAITTHGAITTQGAINSAIAQTTITGTTAGSIVASMPEQGSSYKKVIVYLDGYENDTTTPQTYIFPVAFTNTPVISINSANVPGVTVSPKDLSLAPDTTTAYTGWIIIEGY